MSYVHWLIEFRRDGRTIGYIKNIQQNDGPSLEMTTDANKALHFTSRGEAQGILDNSAFQHAFDVRQFAVEDHQFITESPENPAPSPADGGNV